MSLDSMIPKIWANRFLANLDNALVYARAVNRDYQADASLGDSIEVNKFGDVTIGEYTKNTDFATSAETLDTVAQTLLINQQPYFDFQVDNIDEFQSQPSLMNKAMERASYAMAKRVDAYIASLYEDFTNVIGTAGVPVTPVVDDIYEYLTQAQQLLDEADVPDYGRYAILNPAGIKLLKDSGTFLSDTPAGDLVRYMGQFSDPGMLPRGYKGSVAGFDLFMSNNTPADDVSTSVWTFGHTEGIAMVDSVNTVVGYTPEKRFGDAVKGLYVFGAKVTQPTAGVTLYTTL